MSPSSTDDWERLGEQLTRRRVELAPRYGNRTVFAAERGIDYRLAYDIEEARRTNFRRTTLAGIAVAYAVTLDSVYATLKNGSLEPVPPPPPPPLAWEDGGEGEPQGDAAWSLFPDDAVKRHVWRTPGMSERDRAELIKLIDRTRAEVRGGGEGPRRQERAS